MKTSLYRYIHYTIGMAGAGPEHYSAPKKVASIPGKSGRDTKVNKH